MGTPFIDLSLTPLFTTPGIPYQVSIAEKQMSSGYSRGDFSPYRRWLDKDFTYASQNGDFASKEKFLARGSHFQTVTKARSTLSGLV